MNELSQIESEICDLKQRLLHSERECGLAYAKLAKTSDRCKGLELENAHLRKVHGIKLKQKTVKQSLVFAVEALEKANNELDQARKELQKYKHSDKCECSMLSTSEIVD